MRKTMQNEIRQIGKVYFRLVEEKLFKEQDGKFRKTSDFILTVLNEIAHEEQDTDVAEFRVLDYNTNILPYYDYTRQEEVPEPR